jgi:hypothetical protein
MSVLLATQTVAQQPTTSSATPSVDSAARAAVARMNAPVDSVALARAAAIADTGRMTPGYRDLSRYNTPGYCMAAVRGVEQVTWRRGEQVLVVASSDQDTIPTAAATIGRQCVANLPAVAAIAPAELSNRLRLAILLGDTATVEAVVARQLSLAPTGEARGFVFTDAIGELLNVAFPSLVDHPMQFTLANTMLARLDALGKDARIPRFLAHGQLRNIAQSQRFDTTALLREDKSLRQLVTLFTPEERQDYKNEIMSTSVDSIIVAWYRQQPNLPAVVGGMLERSFAARDTVAFSEDQAKAMIGWLTLLASQVGKPAPPITGQFWFPKGAPHVQPTPGKVTLITRVQKGDGLMDAQIAMLRRVYDRYHDRGLDIVLILKTQGFSWSSPPQTPADEAKTIAWYYYDYLKLPFPIVVDETPFTTQPDGRRVPGPIAFERQYVLPHVLVGRDGRISTLWLGFESESQMDAFVERALAAPAAPASS